MSTLVSRAFKRLCVKPPPRAAARPAAALTMAFAVVIATGGCTPMPFRATHVLRGLTGHRYPDYPVGSIAHERAVDLYTRSESWPDNRVALFVDARESRPALDSLLERSRERVSIELDLRADDPALAAMLDRLRETAARGVTVRLLMDAGKRGPGKPSALDKLEEAGVQVVWFNNPNRSRLLPPADNRSLRRLVVVDGQYAMAGGLPGSGAGSASTLFVAGPAVAALERSFADQWRQAHRNYFARLLPASLVRAARAVVRPTAELNRKILQMHGKTFRPPPYLMPLLDDDRFERAVAAALTGRFAEDYGVENDPAAASALAADALAAARWIAADFPPRPPRAASADGTVDESSPPDPRTRAAENMQRLSALARGLSVSLSGGSAGEVLAPATAQSDADSNFDSEFEPEYETEYEYEYEREDEDEMESAHTSGAQVAFVPVPMLFPRAKENDDGVDESGANAEDTQAGESLGVPNGQATGQDDPSKTAAPDGEAQDGGASMPAVLARTVWAQIGTAGLGATLTISPRALLAANAVEIVYGLIRERRRVYVVNPDDPKPIASEAPTPLTAEDGWENFDLDDPNATLPGHERLLRLARHARSAMGVGLDRVDVRVVASRPSERTVAGLDLAALSLRAARESVDLAGSAARKRPVRLLRDSLKRTEKKSVALRRHNENRRRRRGDAKSETGIGNGKETKTGTPAGVDGRDIPAASTPSVPSDSFDASAASAKRGRGSKEAPDAWMVIDGRLTLLGEGRWTARGFFLSYSLSVTVDDPLLAAAAKRRMENAARAAAP